MKAGDDKVTYDLVKREKVQDGAFIKSLLKALFSHIGLVLSCVAIAVLGAEAYILLELPGEEEEYAAKRKAGQEVLDAQQYLATKFYDYATNKDTYNFTEEVFTERVHLEINTFISFVLNSTMEYGYDGEIDGWEYSWTFPKALLFTITIMTTIGYGHIFPKTFMGKMFTIVYSLIAITVTLVMTAKVGSALADALVYFYSRCCCRWFRASRIKSEIPSRAMRKSMRRRLIDEEVGEEPYMPTNSIAIPIILSIVIIAAYIGIGAKVFSDWEGWTIMSAAYFSMITLTTIGFGDLAPNKSFEGARAGASILEILKMFFCIVYCGVGLALIAMCISLIQEQVTRSAAAALGLSEEVVELDKVEVIQRRSDFFVEPRPTDGIAKDDTAVPGQAEAHDDENEQN